MAAAAQRDRMVQELVASIKRREVRGSSGVAIRTAELLRNVVQRGSFAAEEELLEVVRGVGQELSRANPIELAIGNTVRRVLNIVRQEWAAAAAEELEEEAAAGAEAAAGGGGMFGLLGAASAAPLVGKAAWKAVKQPILEEIAELVDEIKSVHSPIGDQAVEHIHAQEVILTYGVSKTVLGFFREAAKLRKFEVIVAESAPSFSGQQMAMQLSESGIETTLITDSAVFAMMSAVNKVIIGTHAVLANGGLVAHTGAHNIAVAAKAHSVPVVVVTGLYKLCPLYAFDQDTFNEQNAPSEVLTFEDEHVERVEVENPAYDYVQPELVSLYITNFGGHNPSYVYRLLAEYYHPDDY